MSRYTVKVYIVQQADSSGKLTGLVIAAKLTFADAHKIAKKFAPAKVTMIVADKTPHPNNLEHTGSHYPCN